MESTEVIAVICVFIGLPWLVMHYITKWKTAATITPDDEVVLEEMYSLAKRLDARMDTVERLVASDNDDFRPARLTTSLEQDVDQNTAKLTELEQLLAEKKEATR